MDFYIFCSLVDLQADSDMLRHARVAALVPNKNGHHGDDDSDSTSDDTSSHILMCGNSSSSQGGGQQSGSGQNSGNQNSASHQGSAGGGQSSSSGTTGQGSSSGGDGNDEEDKEKIKLAKDSSRQNEVCVRCNGLVTMAVLSSLCFCIMFQLGICNYQSEHCNC